MSIPLEDIAIALVSAGAVVSLGAAFRQWQLNRKRKRNASLSQGMAAAPVPGLARDKRVWRRLPLVPEALAALATVTVIGVSVAIGTQFPSNRAESANSPGPLCASGSLTLTGSTAFAPAAQSIATQYLDTCHIAIIKVAAQGSADGVDGLSSLGASNPSTAASVIAMSDGSAPAVAAFNRLRGTPIGVIIFTLVVNRDTDVINLTTNEIRAIFDGSIVNWRKLGGPDLPIRIVSRGPGSGTRLAFDTYVLGAVEPAPSSEDCVTKDIIRHSPVTLCGRPSTTAVLQAVANTPGAIGFAESSAVQNSIGQGVQPVEINGLPDTFSSVGTGPGKYPFWTVEYVYTYGIPAADSLASKFLAYIDTRPTKELLALEGYTPCIDNSLNLMTTLCAPGVR